MSWLIQDKSFKKEKVELNGNKFIIANGYMGYRGTMEEYSKDQLTACVLSGLYDRVDGKWREPVNAPNGFFIRIYCDGELLSVLNSNVEAHEQLLNFKHAEHMRRTTFRTNNNKKIEFNTKRFLSIDNIHLMAMKSSLICSEYSEIIIKSGFDSDIWDINGPHYESMNFTKVDKLITLEGITGELKTKICAAEAIVTDFECVEKSHEDNNIRIIELKAKAGEEYNISKFVSVFTGVDNQKNPFEAAMECSNKASKEGYNRLFMKHAAIWDKRWDISDVEINGDDEAQLALRYSIYQLLSIAPIHSDKISIPARGLSGQVYKGAIFWDTEMFMLPFFNCSSPSVARNLLMYRYNTLEGARRKAQEYGYRGAFYAWESQETGDDACTLFNVTDVFTNRPMRTYFRDKQVHISADVSHAIWGYVTTTGDESILLDGGAEVILECARFFYSYSYFKADKDRYEILDVTGPDEYHERVNNSAFTNTMVKRTLEIAIAALDLLKNKYEEQYNQLINKLDYSRDIENIHNMLQKIYIPKPDAETGIIEQFDGYNRLEDVPLNELKKRQLDKNEYWGGGCGIATTTQILKQADVVLMLNLFKNQFPLSIKKANWEFYEPRTEHGSSLSSCIYAMLSADFGNADWGYKYFMKTATIDLSGESKQYVGTLYIGGTHPAANGGAWMAVVLGFAGLSFNGNTIALYPHLPSKWNSIKFSFIYRSILFKAEITKTNIKIMWNKKEEICFEFDLAGTKLSNQSDCIINISYDSKTMRGE